MFDIISHQEMQIKIIVIDHYKPIRMAKIKKSGKASVGENLHFYAGWECKMAAPLWRTAR